MNQAIIRGTLSSEPELRVLASGATLATIQLTTRPAEGAAISVPVSISEPPSWIEASQPGDEVVVIGSVRRRFFRAGGATASRVEVEASHVAKATDKRALRKAVRAAQQTVDDLAATLE